MNFALGLLTLLLWSPSPGQALVISLDTSRAPDLADFGRQVRSTLLDWYPRVRSILNSPTIRPVNRIFLSFEYIDPKRNVAAYATGDRYYHFAPNRKPGKPSPRSSYRDGYGTAAYFLNWINQRHRNIIYWINKDCREGTYNNNIFPRLTGKTVDQHWNEMMRS